MMAEAVVHLFRSVRRLYAVQTILSHHVCFPQAFRFLLDLFL